jgi:hypothetical protein
LLSVIIVNGSTTLLLSLGRFFGFLILYTVGRTLWAGDQPVARPLSTHMTKQKLSKHMQTSVSPVGFEPMIPVLGRTKRVKSQTERPL